MHEILPYSVGNAHPGFMGWVHGGGTPVGMLAEMLAAGLNANLGGRDQIPIEVERQVVRWMRELFGFPDTASGLFVTGTSMANLIALLVARTEAIGHRRAPPRCRNCRQTPGCLHVGGRPQLHRSGHGPGWTGKRRTAQHPRKPATPDRYPGA